MGKQDNQEKSNKNPKKGSKKQQELAQKYEKLKIELKQKQQQEEKSQESDQEKPDEKIQTRDDDEGFILTQDDIKDQRKIIIILEKCQLDFAKLNNEKVLLNCDDHRNFIQNKLKKNYSEFRPDITHQCLLTILDSPLNKAGLCQVYIRTEKNVLIYINPSTKIPRTYKRFSYLMAQLLSNLKIRATQTSEFLLKVIKNPVTAHLPSDCLKIGTSCHARLVNMHKFAEQCPKNKPIVFVVGGVSTGDPAMEVDYIDDSICVSKYPLSASVALGRIINAFEDLWEIC